MTERGAEDIAYVEGPGGFVAYTSLGSGPVNLLLCESWITNLEVAWEQPLIERFHRRLASFSRLIRFDKRGSGVSDPIPTSAVAPEPTIEAGVEDAITVLDALDVGPATILGTETGCWVAMQLAAMAPQRVDRLVLVDPLLKVASTEDYPWGMPSELLDGFIGMLHAGYARRDTVLRVVAPDLADDPNWRRWMNRYERVSCPPGVMVTLWAAAADIDLRSLVGAIQAPTLVLEHTDTGWPGRPGRNVAESIAGAKYVEIKQGNMALWANQPAGVLEEIESFVTGAPAQIGEPDRVLAAVLFTDIVDSTRTATQQGDRAWRDLLDRHDAVTAQLVDRYRGRTVAHTGDGIMASFDGPARAVRCGTDLARAMAEIGLTVRVAIHTGEVELRGENLSGIGVHVAARVLGLCQPGEVLVTRTVKDLVTGSGIAFESRGSHQLKGIDDPWELYRVSSA